ncbi:MAG: type II toxin-antitoxin system Phd/YefM family antitoxin [Candidatus Methylomirabilia bacterium]
MTYIAVKDLKQGGRLWEKLTAERELVITRDGRPCAILVSVETDDVEDSLAAIRRALFSAAVTRARRRAEAKPPAAGAVENTIRESRRTRRTA